jgi:hypothetical protein
MLKRTVVLVIGFFLFSSFALGQDGRFAISLNFAGLINKTATGNGLVLTPTDSGGFLASAQMKLVPFSWLQLNYGRSADSQKYNAPPFQYRIAADVTELSGDFLFTPNLSIRNLHPFVLVGGGVLVFGPSNTFINGTGTAIGAVRQIQPAILYGAGVDYPFLDRFALRLQYRGLFYQPPNFKVGFLTLSGHTHLAEPSIGVVFNF